MRPQRAQNSRSLLRKGAAFFRHKKGRAEEAGSPTGDDDRFEYAVEDLEDWEKDFLDAFRRESEASLEDLKQEEDLVTPEFLARMDRMFRGHEAAELDEEGVIRERILLAQIGLGANLRYFRKECGLTALRLAEFSGVRVRLLRNIERGRANPTLEDLVRLANSLDLELKIGLKYHTAQDVPRPDRWMGETLRAARRAHGMTTEQAAKACGVGPRYWGMIENGWVGFKLTTFNKLHSMID